MGWWGAGGVEVIGCCMATVVLPDGMPRWRIPSAWRHPSRRRTMRRASSLCLMDMEVSTWAAMQTLESLGGSQGISCFPWIAGAATADFAAENLVCALVDTPAWKSSQPPRTQEQVNRSMEPVPPHSLFKTQVSYMCMTGSGVSASGMSDPR